MSYFDKKNKNINWVFCSWPVIFILFFVIFFLGKSVFFSYKEESRSKIKREESEFVFNDLQEKENSILNEIKFLKTDKGIETELRDKFRIVKKGEQMAVLIDSSKDSLENSYKSKKDSLWNKVLSFFKNMRD